MGSSKTICAIATAPGEAGIGVIRVSGPDAISIVDSVFRGRTSIAAAKSHHALYGSILDQVIVLPMRVPHSYTGEDVVEISAHGNPRILSRILEVLIARGARLAERGEFTKRAFLNGKLDLTQAEGVLDVIRAVTVPGIDAALDQLSGKLGNYLKGLRMDILSILSPIEACIDFPEEEVPETPRAQIQSQIGTVIHSIEELLAGASAGRMVREGFSAAIVGKPNVGKSSLLNALLREKRAIVTEIPGTTRDTIEEWAEIQGLPMRLIDTAGIRKTENRVEQIGISRSKEALAGGDLALVVLDRSTPLESHDLELLQIAREKRSIVILNKMDLEGPIDLPEVRRLYDGPLVSLSLVQNVGLDQLEKEIRTTVLANGQPNVDTPLITRLRHQECLVRAKHSLEEAMRTLQQKLPLDLAAGDLRGAAEAIGQITGESYTDDLIEKIFSEFCIGK